MQRGGFACDRSSVADALLAKESLMADLHDNYRRLLELAGEFGGVGAVPASFPCHTALHHTAAAQPSPAQFDLCGLLPPGPPAERYQLSGGEVSRGGWKSELEGMHAGKAGR